VRTRYFARRTGVAYAGVFAGLVGGGLVLDRWSGSGDAVGGFVVLFMLAATARGVSALLLSRQSEPTPEFSEGERSLPALPLLRRPPSGPGARLLIYMLFLTAGVTVSSPYFSARMLSYLELSYVQYMILVSASLVTKVAVMPLIGRAARRWGLASVLRFAWLGIAPVPAMCLISDSYSYLLVLQLISGAAWAAHEYATFLLLFETIHVGRRVGILTAYNLGNAVVTVGGSLVGAWFFDRAGGSAAGYAWIFGGSSVLRGACVFLLMRVGDHRPAAVPTFFRAIAVHPVTGLVLRPILATVRRRREEEGEPEAR
jgi:MFS family permease